jgi:hypothetical protein
LASGSSSRWAALQGLTDDEAKAKGPSFLFDDLRQRVKDGKVAFNFNLQLAQPGDKIDSATVPLPEGRKKVNLGRLKITVGRGRCGRPLPDHHLQPDGACPRAWSRRPTR